MAKFWLATFVLAPSARKPGNPLLADGAKAWAIEILQDDAEYAVLLSTVGNPQQPGELSCRIGFVNNPKACSIWSERGFPLVDALIARNAPGALVVQSACFGANSTSKFSMDYDKEVISIGGLMDAISSVPVAQSILGLETVYKQVQQAPDSIHPARQIRQKPVNWLPRRENVRMLDPAPLGLTVETTRLPGLLPLATGPLETVAVWTGDIALDRSTPQFSDIARRPVDRAPLFGDPAFRFEDVEVLGFRIDLSESDKVDEVLDGMIRPLNFHLEDERAASDFRYRHATRTINLELLRYGKMRLRENSPPLGPEDFQGQHELLVRILVGRIDDDTAQGHDPAVYAPVIFVDNPWSKILGREVQGFDKRMADFCARDTGGAMLSLRPDGRFAENGSTHPLPRIEEVRLASGTAPRANGPLLLKLQCPPDALDSDEGFEPISLDLALGVSSLSPARWRQGDFDSPEFRRSFARSVIGDTLKGFRSIQVSPVGRTDMQEVTTWIRGLFSLDDDISVARPGGIANLTLLQQTDAPSKWNDLCALLGMNSSREARISVPAGSWYRMRCSMDFTIDDAMR